MTDLAFGREEARGHTFNDGRFAVFRGGGGVGGGIFDWCAALRDDAVFILDDYERSKRESACVARVSRI